MSVWHDPPDFLTGQRLRSRDLNNLLRDNVLWLLHPPMDVYEVEYESNTLFTQTSWGIIDSTWELSVLVPEDSKVLLTWFGNVNAATQDNQMNFDFVRDGETYLSRGLTSPPADTVDTGLGGLSLDTGIERELMLVWMDVDVSPGVHTYNIAIRNDGTNQLRFLPSRMVFSAEVI